MNHNIALCLLVSYTYLDHNQAINTLICLRLSPMTHQDTLRLIASSCSRGSELKPKEFFKGQSLKSRVFKWVGNLQLSNSQIYAHYYGQII